MFVLLSLVAVALASQAQTKAGDDLLAIQDNSFLLEEAYNQEAGVVQYISVFADSTFVFTNELPIGSQKHQFSYAFAIDEQKFGDVALNYRYQLVGDAKQNLAIAPRFTLLLPTSDESDKTGVQVGLPISLVLGPRVIGHTNIGATYIDDVELSLGQSIIYAPNARMHLMLEGLWSDGGSLVINPGVRWAINLRNGFQIVPGVSYAFSRDGSDAALVYLSFER
jgi:hypothetical protein